MSSKTVSFDWATTPGTATAGTDYVTAGTGGTIPAGATSTTFDVTVNGDTLDEEDETPAGHAVEPGERHRRRWTGLDDRGRRPPRHRFDADASIAEGDAGTTALTFDVSPSTASAKTVTVAWATADDLAAAPSDYAADAGTVTFVPGDTAESVSVATNGDGVAELDEEFRVVLSAPSNATIGDASTGTIVDDELMPVLDIDEPSIVEGQSGTTTLTLSVTPPTRLHPRERGLDHDPDGGGRRFRLRDRQRP